MINEVEGTNLFWLPLRPNAMYWFSRILPVN